MFELPTSLEIDNKTYEIRNKADFRVILDCFDALDDAELDITYRIYTCLIIFYKNINSIEDVVNNFGQDHIQEAVDKMFNFFNCGQNTIGANVNYKLVDWKQDQQLIASAINSVAKVEVRSLDYLHWWTFMGYYLSIGDSPFSTVVSIRNKIKKGKKLENYEREFKKNNPQYFIWNSETTNTKQIENEIRDLWNNNGG